ncbi:hypothetical protein M3Y99_01829900 [Aphelenchoides fujianensis]|nr:hypothetical protein M3Y99_01829900 [Aphelenchoides fujianensis]
MRCYLLLFALVNERAASSSFVPSLNVPPPAVILPNATKDEKKAYGELQRLLLDQLDTSKSPCDSFYEYTCRNGTSSMVEKTTSRMKHRLKRRWKESPPSGPTAKAFHYFRSCVEQVEKPVDQQAGDWRRVLKELSQEVPTGASRQPPTRSAPSWASSTATSASASPLESKSDKRRTTEWRLCCRNRAATEGSSSASIRRDGCRS